VLQEGRAAVVGFQWAVSGPGPLGYLQAAISARRKVSTRRRNFSKSMKTEGLRFELAPFWDTTSPMPNQPVPADSDGAPTRTPGVTKKLSHSALSKQSPTDPIDGRTLASRQLWPKAMEVYWVPWSE
jgi:hypothetical protein